MGFMLAYGLTCLTIPPIVNISNLKNLCSVPNCRTSHGISTPTLGGIAVFIGVLLSTIIISGPYSIVELRYIFAGMIIVFFLGMKDDILIIDPVKKLIGQLIATAIVAVLADIRITNLYGLFNIGQLDYLSSILLTIFVFILIINGINLIDGIDGLAAGIGMITTSSFGILFLIQGNIGYSIFSFSFVGTLAAFFWFNVFRKKYKIFLGDTGSIVMRLYYRCPGLPFFTITIGYQGGSFNGLSPSCCIRYPDHPSL